MSSDLPPNSGDTPDYDPDKNISLIRLLATGAESSVQPATPTPPELAPAVKKAGTKGTGTESKETRGIAPKASVTPRPTSKDIAQDREGYLNRHPFDSGRW